MKRDEITGKLVPGLPLERHTDGEWRWPVPQTPFCDTCGQLIEYEVQAGMTGKTETRIHHPIRHVALKPGEVRTGPYGYVEVKVDHSGNDTFHPTVRGF